MLLFRTRCLLQQQLLLLLVTRATHLSPAGTSSTGHGGDKAALVAFKERISSHSGVLDSWNQSISYCSWQGVTCSKRHQQRVVDLDLRYQSLTGTISPAIGNLTNSLQGEIPPRIGCLGRLRSLVLSRNMLTGVIPSNISRCTRLLAMYIRSNKGIRGSIPGEIGNMPSLLVLVLANNNITGTIPTSLGNLSRLMELSLSFYHLEGSIPAGIGNIPYLYYLYLSSNSLSGLLPPSLYNLSSLKLFDVSGDNFSEGRIPTSIGNLANLEYLDFSGCLFTGVIHESIGNLTQLN